MKKIFNYTIVAAALYFSVNWIADNPRAVKKLRKEMNSAVAQGIDKAAK
jgi:hypothetical protein